MKHYDYEFEDLIDFVAFPVPATELTEFTISNDKVPKMGDRILYTNDKVYKVIAIFNDTTEEEMESGDYYSVVRLIEVK